MASQKAIFAGIYHAVIIPSVGVRGDHGVLLGGPMSWRSAPWNPRDDEMQRRLLALLAAEYPDADVATEAYYDWQYRRPPYGEAMARVAVADDGAIAGQYVVAPMRLVAGGVEQAGALSLLTLTDPRHRGAGIFTGLAREVFAECAARGLRFILGFPNPNSHGGFVRSLGFRELGHVPLLLRFVAPSRLVRTRFGA